MEKLFVPYSIALALKELGFDETCLAKYNTLTERLEYKSVAAPLYDQVINWFREKHGIIIVDDTHEGWCSGKWWNFKILRMDNLKGGPIDKPYMPKQKSDVDYYIAKNNAIEEAILLIKNK